MITDKFYHFAHGSFRITVDLTQKEIKDIENSYLAIDEIEIGSGNRISLWLFGFVY
ncbi:hypothetical protein SAMN06265340_10271 [Desulfurobacterium atlanticum]|uniref:Uncharacterized protein n=1 Tax=Desulfurobacterium atlanticum TaxID=240169 RepID=A0A238Y3A9_9BACT|nr:hypothetical protein SAMN06265340_10271 [Desulfurobacterium atlanticum]